MIWIVGAASIVSGFFKPPAYSCLSPFSPEVALAAIAMPIAFFGTVAFFVPHSPFFTPGFAAFVDTRAGHGFLESFLVRLKPILFFGIGSLIRGFHQLWWCDQVGIQVTRQSEGWFFISLGAAFIFMHTILRFRKVVAV